MAKITFLGTSSFIPTASRDNTSLLFSRKNNTFLIDCPGSPSQKLLKVKKDFRKLQNVIITHHHPDHIYGIVSLIQTQMNSNKNLTIFTNSICAKLIKQLVTLFELNKKIYPKIKYVNVFKDKFFFNSAGLKLQAIKNTHVKDSFGIKFSFDKQSVFYTSDTSFSTKMLTNAAPFNYLIHECSASSSLFKKHPSLYNMHTSAKELTSYLKDKPNIKLIPVHFFLVDKKEERRIKEELKPLGKKVTFVKDLQTLPL